MFQAIYLAIQNNTAYISRASFKFLKFVMKPYRLYLKLSAPTNKKLELDNR